MSRLDLNHKMMKYSKIWANGTKKVDDDYEAIPWTASTSERSKMCPIFVASDHNFGSSDNDMIYVVKKVDMH